MGLDIMVTEVVRKKDGKLKQKDRWYWRRFGELQHAFFNSWEKLNPDMTGRYAVDAFNGVYIDLVPQVVDDLDEVFNKKRIKSELKKYKKWNDDKESFDDYSWEINHWTLLKEFLSEIRSELKKGKRFVYCCSW